MAYTNEVSEVMYPLASHVPLARDASTNYSNFVSLANYHRAWLFVQTGAMEAASHIDVGLQQAQDAAGTGVKAITGKTITQLTQAGGDGDDLLCIELQTEELDVDGGFEHVRFYVTIGHNWVTYSATLFGVEPRYAPVATTNWTEIVE